MSAQEDGGYAFPTDHSTSDDYPNVTGGLSIRDYFATHALRAMVDGPGLDTVEEAAQRSYEYADAMLKARQS